MTAEEILQNESELRQNYDMRIKESELDSAVERAEMNLFAMLSPALSKDGDEWIVVYGDDSASEIVGRGDTPRHAVWDFNKAWDRN